MTYGYSTPSSHSPHARILKRAFTAVTAVTVLAACDATEPSAVLAPQASEPTVSTSTVSEQSTPVTIVWNRESRELVKKYATGAAPAMRVYALVSIAQYNALVAADDAKAPRKRPSARAAIAAASTGVLSYLYPAEATLLEQKFAQFKATLNEPPRMNMSAGEVIGRGIAAQLIARAQQDNFFKPFTGVIPTGPGFWQANPTPPAFATLGQAKTFVLASGDQFRPVAPPAYGSPAFLKDLTEVRTISDARTPAQDSIAKFWSLQGGTVTPLGQWNVIADSLAMRDQLDERRTARTFALLNIAGFDGLITSHDAKYVYWLIRPSQADPEITLPIALPSFPSYPSNHALISAAAAVVLGKQFPADRKALMVLAEEAAISRVYGGIHYRFDATVGVDMGKRVGMYVLSRAPKGNRAISLR